MTETKPLNSDEKTWGMLCHLAALAMFIFPFGNIIGPLIIWAIKKEELLWVDKQGKEAMNFQISMTIYMFLSAILILLIIGIFLLIALGIINVIFIIIASIRANSGEEFTYPLSIQFIK